jgi:hypothetical protein
MYIYITITQQLHEILKLGPVIIASADREFHPGNYLYGEASSTLQLAEGRSKLYKRSVAVPMRAHYLLDEAAEQRPNGFSSNRSIPLFFKVDHPFINTQYLNINKILISIIINQQQQ